MAEFDPNLADKRNNEMKCALCGRSLRGVGVVRFTDGSTLEKESKSFEGSGCMQILVGSECAKKKEIL